MLSDKQMLDRMKDGWRGGLRERTVCGRGSLLANTANAREYLADLATRYGIRTVNDAGAGDLHWIRRTRWRVEYRAFDLIPRVAGVSRLDITTEVMPPCDAILCRMVLNHLDPQRVQMAIDCFKQSGKYLIATQINRGEGRGQFAWLDLRDYLGEPMESRQDGHDEFCRLALWTL